MESSQLLDKRLRTALLWALVGLLSVVVLALAIWVIPLLLTRSSPGLTAAARLTAENNVRTPVVAALAVVGAAALTAGVTWRATKTNLEGQAIDRARLDLAEQNQVTDRYTKAIDQLGSEKLDVRVGGIYALERIARDSPRDHPTVMEVLATFVRDNSRLHWLVPEPNNASTPERSTRPDVQAALTVIARRDATHERQAIDLSRADLIRANLHGAHLANADLTRANLDGADLTGANLTSADLRDAKLTDVNLYGADLPGANLGDADLTDAVLTDATLTGANLRGTALVGADLTLGDLASANLADANLTGANLSDADLTDANLFGAQLADAYLDRADLTGANLTGTNLTKARLTDVNFTGAKWPEDASAPGGWQRDAQSGRMKRADTNSGGKEAN